MADIVGGTPALATKCNPSPVLRADGITKHFGHITALDGASIEVLPGECHALVGDNGAGKSTFIKILSGVYQQDDGVIEIDGNSVSFTDPNSARTLGLETVYQDLALATDMSVPSNLFLGRETRKRGFLGKLGFVDNKTMRQETFARLESLAVTVKNIDGALGDLSGGQRQAVAIARAVMWAKKLIFMDEPTAALGVSQTAMVLDLIRRIKHEGISIVLISHNMSDVMAVSDRVSVMRLGRRVAALRTSETTAEEIIGYMTGAITSDV